MQQIVSVSSKEMQGFRCIDMQKHSKENAGNSQYIDPCNLLLKSCSGHTAQFHIQKSSKKTKPTKAPKVGSFEDIAMPGIVFKLYPTIVSRTVSDYVLNSLSVADKSPFNFRSLPTDIFSTKMPPAAALKRRHSKASFSSSLYKPKCRKSATDDDCFGQSNNKWDEDHSVGPAGRRASTQSEQLVPRNSSMATLGSSKENSSDSEIDVTSLNGQGQSSASTEDGPLHSAAKAKRKGSLHRRGAGPMQSQTANAAAAFGSSLSSQPSHIVCNKLLMTTSRRISASGTVDGRLCASCEASITPYWRDGWNEELMLCNACGLRFQKFLKRCCSCSYIPRKEDNDLPDCPHCHSQWI